MASVDPSRLGCRRGEAGHIDEVNGGASAVQHANEVRQGVAPVVGALLWPRNRKCSRRSPRNNPLSVISRTGRDDGERLVDRAGSRILHAVGALQVVDQALSELALLIPQELARGRLVGRREMRSEVSQPLAGQHVVGLDEGAQIAFRRGAQEGRQPDQRPRPRIAPAQIVETRKVVGWCMARLVEGKSTTTLRSSACVESDSSGSSRTLAKITSKRRCVPRQMISW